jgi:hypothetical protein
MDEFLTAKTTPHTLPPGMVLYWLLKGMNLRRQLENVPNRR